MGKLIYSAIMSLDGYVADEGGNFDWAAPDEEVHSFVNDLERPICTYLYGRRMYDVMVCWETAHTVADQPPVIREFTEIWQAADKVVYSKTLEDVFSARTRIERLPQLPRLNVKPEGRGWSTVSIAAASAAGSGTGCLSGPRWRSGGWLRGWAASGQGSSGAAVVLKPRLPTPS